MQMKTWIGVLIFGVAAIVVVVTGRARLVSGEASLTPPAEAAASAAPLAGGASGAQ